MELSSTAGTTLDVSVTISVDIRSVAFSLLILSRQVKAINLATILLYVGIMDFYHALLAFISSMFSSIASLATLYSVCGS